MTLPAELVERLRELLERVEKCEGADREIDAAVREVLGIEKNPYTAYIRNCTASVDEVVTLIEKVLPGNHWSVSRQCEYPALAGRVHKFAAFVGDYGNPKRAEGATPALALLAALLRSIQGEK